MKGNYSGQKVLYFCINPLSINDEAAFEASVKKGKKTENVQDAHEAIRCTSVTRTPESIKKYLSDDEYKVYSIIYARSIACLMADSKILSTTILVHSITNSFDNLMGIALLLFVMTSSDLL